MPAIQDVADQINARLDRLIADAARTATVTGQVRDQLAELNHQIDTLVAESRPGSADHADGSATKHRVARTSQRVQQ